MRLHHKIVAQLRALATDSDPDTASDPGFPMAVQGFLDAVVHAVPSVLSVSLTVHRHELPITITADADRVLPVGGEVTELTVLLPRRGTGEQPAALRLQSADSRGLAQLGADLLTLLDLDPRRALLQTRQRPAGSSTEANHNTQSPPTHLTDVPAHVHPGGLAAESDDVSAVDRALGILLDRGFLPPEGLAELTRRGAAAGDSVPTAARRVLAETQRPALP